MLSNSLIFTLFLVFMGAAVMSTVALYTRQSLLVAYMLLGIIIGPWGLKWVGNAEVVQKTGDIGIIFLLFLLGLNLTPQSLYHLLRKTTWVTVISSLVFAAVGWGVARLTGFTNPESLIVGAAMMFSSTIIGLKLLPTTALHHQRVGEIMISILLMQDLIAILTLLLLHGAGIEGIKIGKLFLISLAMPGLLAFAYLFERYILAFLFKRFSRIREYIFLLAIAWCLGMSVLGEMLGLSFEIGAFIAGVSIATGPIALYMAESLKPVRDFFLVMFFFSVGASFNWQFLPQVIVPAVILATILLLIKPVVFGGLLRQVSENNHLAWEIGWRLGQVSEFSLLIGYVAVTSSLIHERAAYLIQATTMLTFIASSYIVVLRYPTPVALSDKLRRD